MLTIVTMLANYANWSRDALYPLLHVIDCSSFLLCSPCNFMIFARWVAAQCSANWLGGDEWLPCSDFMTPKNYGTTCSSAVASHIYCKSLELEEVVFHSENALQVECIVRKPFGSDEARVEKIEPFNDSFNTKIVLRGLTYRGRRQPIQLKWDNGGKSCLFMFPKVSFWKKYANRLWYLLLIISTKWIFIYLALST